MSQVAVSEPGWVVASCTCGYVKEITSAEVLTLRRLAIVKGASLPEKPPTGLPTRPAEHGAERLRRLARDMWHRGAIDDAAYERALKSIGPR